MQQLGIGIFQSIQALSHALVQFHVALQSPITVFPQNHPSHQHNIFDYGSLYPHAKDILLQSNDIEENNYKNIFNSYLLCLYVLNF